MNIDLTKKKQLDLKLFLRAVKYISIGCGVVTIAGLVIYPLMNNNYPNKTKDKANKTESKLTKLEGKRLSLYIRSTLDGNNENANSLSWRINTI